MQFFLKRLLWSIPVWLGVSALSFGFVHLLPGNPATVILGIRATPAKIRVLDQELGLQHPLAVQYWDWLSGVLHGNFGHSLITGVPVISLIGQRLMPTAELVLFAFVIAVGVGVPLGVLSARRGGRASELVVRMGVLLGLSVPSFVFGTVLIVVAALVVPHVRMIGYVPFLSNPLANLGQMFWPALTLALTIFAIVVRYTRVSLRDSLAEEYTVTARAMGLRPRTVTRNALRNALLPLIGAIGAQVAFLVGGVVVIEDVFDIPGLGTLTLTAVTQRDYTLLQGIVILIATAVIVVNLVVDGLYVLADPKLRHA